MIIHRNTEGSALEVGVCGVDSVAITTTPRDLQDVQEG